MLPAQDAEAYLDLIFFKGDMDGLLRGIGDEETVVLPGAFEGGIGLLNSVQGTWCGVHSAFVLKKTDICTPERMEREGYLGQISHRHCSVKF